MTDQPAVAVGEEAFTDEHRDRLLVRARAGRPLTPDDVLSIMRRVELTPEILASVRTWLVESEIPFDDDEPENKRHLLRLWLRAWNPRPLAGDIGTYKARKGIDKQEGRGTYYTGKKQYVESLPPK